MLTRREALAVVVAASATALAQTKPNFTGRWQIDAARSPDAPPDLVEVIDHRDPKVVIETSVSMSQPLGIAIAGLLAPKLQLATDASKNANELPPGLTLISNSEWQGDRLVTKWRIEGLPNGPLDGTWTRYLTDAGKTMVVDVLAAPRHERVETKLVFVKK